MNGRTRGSVVNFRAGQIQVKRRITPGKRDGFCSLCQQFPWEISSAMIKPVIAQNGPGFGHVVDAALGRISKTNFFQCTECSLVDTGDICVIQWFVCATRHAGAHRTFGFGQWGCPHGFACFSTARTAWGCWLICCRICHFLVFQTRVKGWALILFGGDHGQHALCAHQWCVSR